MTLATHPLRALPAIALAATLAGCSHLPDALKPGTSAGATPSAATSAAPASQGLRTRAATFERASEGTGTTVSTTADQRIQLEIPSDISFDVGRSAVKPALAALLTRYAGIARAEPNISFTIVGHTDTSGNAAANNTLSRERALSTRDYLIARGVPITRLQAEGRGSAEPLADNGTPEGRARNRRVTIYVSD